MDSNIIEVMHFKFINDNYQVMKLLTQDKNYIYCLIKNNRILVNTLAEKEDVFLSQILNSNEGFSSDIVNSIKDKLLKN